MNRDKKRTFIVRLTEEDYTLLESQVRDSGLDRTNYIRKLIRDGGSNGFYSPIAKRALENISEGYCGLKEEKLPDECYNYLEMIRGGVKQLWGISR